MTTTIKEAPSGASLRHISELLEDLVADLLAQEPDPLAAWRQRRSRMTLPAPPASTNESRSGWPATAPASASATAPGTSERRHCAKCGHDLARPR